MNDYEEVEARWIVCRPRGGLNDTLCQIEKCWQFAKLTGRRLIIDSEGSGLLLPFDDVFVFRGGHQGVNYHSLDDDTIDALNTFPAWPADIESKVITYESTKDAADEFFTLPSHSPLKYDLSHDYPAPVLVYEAMGGGIASYCFLSRVTLHNHFRREIQEKLAALPDRYASVHVRHSDLSTDYQTLFAVVKKRSGRLPVFVASDNSAVIDYAREVFGVDRLLFLPSQQPRDGKPLHTPETPLTKEQRHQLTLETLTELFALAGASDFFFGDVTNRVGVSGFSRLARFLAENPDTRAHLLVDDVSTSDYQRGRAHHVSSLPQRLYERLRWRQDSKCR